MEWRLEAVAGPSWLWPGPQGDSEAAATARHPAAARGSREGRLGRHRVSGWADSAALRALCALLCASVIAPLMAPAWAFRFGRLLQRGSHGRDVKALEIRVAGWLPAHGQKRVVIDRRFGRRTARAVAGFQRTHGLAADGIAGSHTFRSLHRIEDRDGSTAHFNWGEFKQHRNSGCPSSANRHAGTFKGGAVRALKVRNNVRRVMWRLEAMRAKGGHRPIEVVSGFRSRRYNACVGGAGASQHLYGTGVDIKMHGVSSRRARRLAKRTHFQGIECYSSTSHNHLDLRAENKALRKYRHWWWPKRDRSGRHLASDGRPCIGEKARRTF